MKRLYPHILFGLSLLFILQAAAQEPRLSYRLQAGERYLLDIDLQQNTRSEAMNSDEITLYSRTKMEFIVDSTDDQQQFHMTVHYVDLLLSMLAPGMNIDINSSTGKNLMLSNMIDSLSNGAFHMVMDGRGEMKSIEGLEPLFESLATYPARDTNEHQVILKTLEEVYGPNSFKSLLSLFVSVYPVVQPMTNWTSNVTYYFNTKPVLMVNRYNLTKSTDEVLVIQGLGMLNAMKEFQERTSMGVVKSAVSGSQTYDFQMDRKTGWLKRCVSRQRLLIETTILKSSYLPSGLKIPSYTETVFEVKGSRIE
ncbi:MAG: DUF6263 family protein [Bacteroidota bacterium]